MYTNKQDLVKQVNWALRAREPMGFKAVSDVSAKWKPADYEVRFDGGSAVIAHFEGRIVALAWQQMGDVERHLFAKDCDELLHRDVKELGQIFSVYLNNLVQIGLEKCKFSSKIGLEKCKFSLKIGWKSVKRWLFLHY